MDKTGKKTLVIGASPKPERYSNKAMRMLLQHGHEVTGLAKRAVQTKNVQIVTTFPEEKDIHTVTMYIGPSLQPEYYESIENLQPRRVIFNPGTENPEFQKRLRNAGIEVIENCTLVMLRSGTF
jgi:uncharacterized protein